MRNKRNEDRAGALRTGMWTAAIVAVGALVCGLGGGALALSLPAAGSAQALPVYTSLNLVAEDEPVATVWQDFDPEGMVNLSSFALEEQMSLGMDWLPTGLYSLFDQHIYSVGLFWAGGTLDMELPWQTPAADPGSAFYLYQVALPDGLTCIDQGVNELVTCGSSMLDMGLQDGCISVRYSFPDLEKADPARFEETQALVQERLLDLFYGRSTALMGADIQSLSANTWLEERISFYSMDEWLDAVDPQEGTAEDRLMALCEALMIDLQTIRLDNELLVILSDQVGSGMLGLYCDVRLRCVTGYVMQM